jgi:hypothetical protein
MCLLVCCDGSNLSHSLNGVVIFARYFSCWTTTVNVALGNFQYFVRASDRNFLGKAICCLCDLDQLLTRIFSSPNSPSSPTPASYSGEFRVRVRVSGLGFGVSGGGAAVPTGPRGRAGGGRPARLSVFKPLDLHGRYPQQDRRWGSPWSGTRRSAQGHKTRDLYRFG